MKPSPFLTPFYNSFLRIFRKNSSLALLSLDLRKDSFSVSDAVAFPGCSLKEGGETASAKLLTLHLQPVTFNFHLEFARIPTVALTSHASKVMLRILQARPQQCVNRELPDVQAGFRKGRETRDQMPTSAGSSEKQESSRKTSISALLIMPKPLTVWITRNCVKF